MENQLMLVLDFGGQYRELIAGAVRSLSVYSEIKPGDITAQEIKELNPIGIILTGGPNSVYLPDAPKFDPEIFTLGVPIMGICYGMQAICHALGGEVVSGEAGEYGRVTVYNNDNSSFKALMSHRDVVKTLPTGFVETSHTDNCIASCEDAKRKIYCVQYHPESKSTDDGKEIIRRFAFDVCGAKGDYKLDDYIQKEIVKIRETVGENGKILLGLSGGVDSSVCAALLSKAVGERLTCVFVDHGLMRLNEGDEIENIFANRKLKFVRVNAEKRFLQKLKGLELPEEKRKVIGEEFARVFEEEAAKLGEKTYLAQGTIYPDVVESGLGNGAVIKSHHNVGGLPEDLNFLGVIEPLAGLFKDEVRILGRKLGLPAFLINRQPFPGPGLGIRVIGEVTAPKLEIVRRADAIFREELASMKRKPSQYFAVLTNTRSVGVKGDDRSYDYVIALRAVYTNDFMTCDYATLSHKTLTRISARITSEINGASRVVYDITGKPPGTVEFE